MAVRAGVARTFLRRWQMVWISAEKGPGKARRTKSEKGSSTVTKRPHEEVGGGVVFVLMDKETEGVRVCKGIRRRGARVDGENAKAENSICAEAGGRGFNTLRAAWTEDRLSLCSRLGSTSLRPRRGWRENKLEI